MNDNLQNQANELAKDAESWENGSLGRSQKHAKLSRPKIRFAPDHRFSSIETDIWLSEKYLGYFGVYDAADYDVNMLRGRVTEEGSYRQCFKRPSYDETFAFEILKQANVQVDTICYLCGTWLVSLTYEDEDGKGKPFCIEGSFLPDLICYSVYQIKNKKEVKA